ncbi:MAG: hypothetical protein KGL75_06765 [Acidobacteriota bacterium]|nr:hypothetical protein [Acidobacteriota bacterium]
MALLGVVLPKLSGTEVFARIHEENPEWPVILRTGYSPDISRLDRVRRCGLPILLKPCSARELARRDRETLDHHGESALQVARNGKSPGDQLYDFQ